MKVRDVMHKGVTWVDAQTPIEEVARRMHDEDIGAVPVGENDRLIGMVTDRDICCRVVTEGRSSAKLTARDVMTDGIVYCRENEDVEDALHLMENKQIRRLPVLNEDKRMVGMLALGDIAHKLSRDLSGEVINAVTAHHD